MFIWCLVKQANQLSVASRLIPARNNPPAECVDSVQTDLKVKSVNFYSHHFFFLEPPVLSFPAIRCVHSCPVSSCLKGGWNCRENTAYSIFTAAAEKKWQCSLWSPTLFCKINRSLLQIWKRKWDTVQMQQVIIRWRQHNKCPAVWKLSLPHGLVCSTPPDRYIPQSFLSQHRLLLSLHYSAL